MLIRAAWLVLALIHLLPALALVRPQLLTSLYDVEPGSPTFLLLWHRAALFAVIVLVAVWAAFSAPVRPLAAVAVALSMVSFLLLYALNGQPANLRTIAVADLLGLPFLLIVSWAAFRPA